LLGADGTAVTSQTQFLSKLCPASGNTPYTGLVDSLGVDFSGQLVHDNGVCVTGTGRGTVVTASNATGAVSVGGGALSS